MIPFWKKTGKHSKPQSAQKRRQHAKPAVPRTAQQSIPMQRMFEDGTCRVKNGYYAGIEKSTEECGAVLRRGKRPQGKIADSLNRKHRGFFPFGGESSVFFFVIGAFGTNAQPASGGCSTQRVWDYPNKHFAMQKWRLYIRTPCLRHRCSR